MIPLHNSMPSRTRTESGTLAVLIVPHALATTLETMTVISSDISDTYTLHQWAGLFHENASCFFFVHFPHCVFQFGVIGRVDMDGLTGSAGSGSVFRSNGNRSVSDPRVASRPSFGFRTTSLFLSPPFSKGRLEQCDDLPPQEVFRVACRRGQSRARHVQSRLTAILVAGNVVPKLRDSVSALVLVLKFSSFTGPRLTFWKSLGRGRSMFTERVLGWETSGKQ